mgnify:CR=1 FL=1
MGALLFLVFPQVIRHGDDEYGRPEEQVCQVCECCHESPMRLDNFVHTENGSGRNVDQGPPHDSTPAESVENEFQHCKSEKDEDEQLHKSPSGQEKPERDRQQGEQPGKQ